MVLQSLVNEIDIYFFRHLEGAEATNAQAALAPSLIMVWLFGGSLSAISVGTQALTARRYAEARATGEGVAEGNAVQKRHDAGAVLTNALAFCIVSSLLMSVVAHFSIGPLLSKIIKTPGALQTAVAYSEWRVYGIISMVTTIGIKSFLDGIGKTYVHFIASLVMNVFNVLFCWMFIFGHLGAPRMGAPGAGLGAFAATWIGFVIVILFALRERREYAWMMVSKLSRKITWDLIKLSLPAAIATIVMMAGFSVFVSFAGQLDKAAVVANSTAEAVNGAVTTDVIGLMKLIFTACLGFGTATATLVSQSLGAKRPDLAAKFGWTSVRIGLVLFAAIGFSIGVLFTHQIAHFLNDSPAVQQALLTPLRIMGIVTPIISIAMILTEALFGAGSTIFVASAQMLLVFGVLIPLAYVFSIVLGIGVAGMWMAAAVYAIIAAITMSTMFHRGSWKRNIL